MRVLAGLYEPQHAEIEVDGRLVEGLRHLGAISTLIPQEADVFESTVRENIAFGLPRANAELREAVHASLFDDVLAADGADPSPGGRQVVPASDGHGAPAGSLQRAAGGGDGHPGRLVGSRW